MPIANITTPVAYAKKLMTLPYQKSVFSILCNPDNVIYTEGAEKVLVRSAIAGAAGNYNGSFVNSVGGEDIVDFTEYTLIFDRFKKLATDYGKEAPFIMNGMRSSIEALTEDYMNRQLASEMDAVTAATLYNKLDAENQITEATLPVTLDSVFDTLDTLRAKAFTAGFGFSHILFAFVSGGVFANIEKFIRVNNGLANSAVIKDIEYTVDYGEENIDGIVIKTRVVQYNNMIILPVADDRMNTSVDLLDGTSEGQTSGGWKAADDAKALRVLVVPEGTAFMGIRFHIVNFHIPHLGAPETSLTVGLDKGMRTILGNVIIENGGVNQLGHNYEANIRTIYGADILPLQKKGIFAVTAA